MLQQLWHNKWLLTGSAGLLLGFSFPPFNLPFLQIPAFILLFRLADLCSTYRAAAYWSYFAFLLWNLIGTYWMMMATVGGGIAAILANSVLMTIPFVLQRLALNKVDHPLPQSILVASAWTGYEYLHHFWDLAWPWLALGNGWANYTSLIQYISYTGYLGISFWVVFTAALFYVFIRHSYRKKVLTMAITATLIAPLVSLGMLAFQSQERPEDQSSVHLVLAQPDFDSYATHYGYKNAIDPLRDIMHLSDSLRNERTDAIIWPENAVQPYISNRNMSNRTVNKIKRMLRDSSRQWDVPIVTGTTYFEYFKPDTQALPSLVRNPNSVTPYIYYNAAVGFYPDRSLSVYKKVHLVPLVERIPFLLFLNRIDPFGIQWHELPWYGQGTSFTQFKISNTQTPALVCYDSVFPHWIRGFVNRGSGFLTIITNDGWWGNTSGHLQHFAYARLRAVEFRRWVARSANNGISGLISPDGRVVKRTEYKAQTAITANVPVRNDLTFFARFGGWLPISCLVMIGIWLMQLVYRSFKTR